MTENKNSRRTYVRLAAVGAVVVAAVAVYVSIDAQSNTADAACAAAIDRAAALDDHAVGQLAAFRYSTDPARLNHLAFETGAGEPMTVADFSGQVVLLNLWATWCPPCREEMPSLAELDTELGGDTFSVLAVSLDTGDTPALPRQFLEEIGVEDLGLYIDPTTRMLSDIQAMGLRGGLPTTILLDEEGCMLGVIEGPADWAGPDALNLIEAAIGG